MIEHVRLDCRAGIEHTRLQARGQEHAVLRLKAWDQGQNRLVELHDLKT